MVMLLMYIEFGDAIDAISSTLHELFRRYLYILLFLYTLLFDT